MHPEGNLPFELWFDQNWLEGVQLDCDVHIWTKGVGPTAKLSMTTDAQRFVRAVDGVAGRQLDTLGRHDHSIIWGGGHFYIVNEPNVMTSIGLHDAFRGVVRETWGTREGGDNEERRAHGEGEIEAEGVIGIAEETSEKGERKRGRAGHERGALRAAQDEDAVSDTEDEGNSCKRGRPRGGRDESHHSDEAKDS
jgi:hypothetical protein